MLTFNLYSKGERGFYAISSLVEHGYAPSYVFLESQDQGTQTYLDSKGIAYSILPSPRDPQHITLVSTNKPDLIVSAGYSRIFPMSLIDIPKLGTINCHGGRLPNYRGASPIPWQIINGETFGVAYILKMTQGIDDGNILAEAKYEISCEDTARNVTDKVLQIFSRLLPNVIKQIDSIGEIPIGIPQTELGAIRWGRRFPEDGKIDWKLPARDVFNLIRALDDPYPGAFFFFENFQIKVWKASLVNESIRGVPGRVVGRDDSSLLVLCGDGAIKLHEIEISGEKIPGNQPFFGYGVFLG